MGLETIALVAGIAGSLASVGSSVMGMTKGDKKAASTPAASTTSETPEQIATKKKTAIAALQKESEGAGSTAALSGSGNNVTQKTLLGL